MARTWALLAVGAAALAVGRAAAPDEEEPILMFKVVGSECAQASIARKFQAAATALAGLQPGACGSQGFDEVEGSKAIKVPVLGQISMQLHRKADILNLAMDVGAKALGLQGSSPCCRVCKRPDVRYFSVDAAHGRCTETCVPPGGAYWLLKAMEPHLEKADGQSCSSRGFPAYNTTMTRGIPPASLSWDVYGPPAKGLVALSKVVAGVCGQAIVNESSEAQVAKAIGLERGYCLDRGFTQAAGSKVAEAPAVGAVQMALFRKPGELDLVDALRVSLSLWGAERVTLYKIADGVCGEATIDKKYEAPAESFAGLKEGTCKDQDYTTPAGSKDLHVPVLGDIKIALYKRATASQVIV